MAPPSEPRRTSRLPATRAGSALRLFAGSLRQDRAGAGCGRHMVPAAHRRRQACPRADAHRRPDRGRRAGEMGLVYKVFDDAAFAGEVAAFAKRFANGPTMTYDLIK